MTDPVFLVADVGGTNTRVAISDGLHLRDASIRRFRNADYPDIETILKQFLSDCAVKVCAAAVDTAGPVKDGVGTLTNRNWVITRETLTSATGAAHVAILNDLQAQGHGLPHLDPQAVETITSSPTDVSAHAAKLVVNVGTGFNAVAAYNLDQRTLVPPSECGHASLPVQSAEDLRLSAFIESAHGFAAVEEVLSGRGLELVYRFAAQEMGEQRQEDAARIMAQLEQDPVATKAGEIFVRLLGSVTGNLALVHLPFGGIYLVGGVARAFGPHLHRLGFTQAVQSKGRFSDFMRQFGIFLVHDDYAGLKGLASHLTESTTAD